jgi:hypothetical protein
LTDELCICSNTSEVFSYGLYSAYPSLIALHEITSQTFMLSKTFQASCMLPHLTNMVITAFPTRTATSNPALTICMCNHCPCVRAIGLIHTLRRLMKVMLSSFTLSYCICQKTSNTSLWFLFWTDPANIAFPQNKVLLCHLINSWRASFIFPHLAYIWMRLLSKITSIQMPLLIMSLWTILGFSRSARLTQTLTIHHCVTFDPFILSLLIELERLSIQHLLGVSCQHESQCNCSSTLTRHQRLCKLPPSSHIYCTYVPGCSAWRLSQCHFWLCHYEQPWLFQGLQVWHKHWQCFYTQARHT